MPDRQARGDTRPQREILLRRQRLHRDVNALDQVRELIIGKRQRDLPGFDLRQVEYVIDRCAVASTDATYVGLLRVNRSMVG